MAEERWNQNSLTAALQHSFLQHASSTSEIQGISFHQRRNGFSARHHSISNQTQIRKQRLINGPLSNAKTPFVPGRILRRQTSLEISHFVNK